MKFETINNTLCRMVEPEPLTPEATFPCVVQLIQDDSPMGGYNRTMETAYTLSRTLTALRVFSDSNVEAKDILLPAGNYNRFEIIGYPVVDGSAEWGEYQTRQGKTVIHEYGCVVRPEYDGSSRASIFEYYSTGWRIHEPANVGTPKWAWDKMIKKHKVFREINGTVFQMNACGYVIANNGEFAYNYEQFLMIEHRNDWQLYEEPEPKPLLADAKEGWLVTNREGHTSTIKYVDNNKGVLKYAYEVSDGTTIYVRENGMFNIINHNSNYDIIATEPLAEVGSAEWAWQMMLLGKKVTYGSITDSYWLMVGGECEYRKNDNSQQDTWRRDKHEFLNAHGETHTWQLYEPKPEPSFAVGDVVRHHSSPYDCGVGYIVEIDGNNACVFFVDDMDTDVVSMSELSRCNPSEVIVKIGCLEGTVTYAISDDCFLLAKVYDPQHRACCIDMSMLDTPTRELVESLLKAQEEK